MDKDTLPNDLAVFKNALMETRATQMTFFRSQLTSDEEDYRDATHRFFVLYEYFIGLLIEEAEQAQPTAAACTGDGEAGA